MSFADGVALVRKRGELMQAAVPNGQGTMAAVLGLDDAAIAQCCEQVAGEVDAATIMRRGRWSSPVKQMPCTQRLRRLVQACGAVRCEWPVSFTSNAAGGSGFSEALLAVELSLPAIPVYQNVHGQVADSVDEMRQLLVEQLYSPSDGPPVLPRCLMPVSVNLLSVGQAVFLPAWSSGLPVGRRRWDSPLLRVLAALAL